MNKSNFVLTTAFFSSHAVRLQCCRERRTIAWPGS